MVDNTKGATSAAGARANGLDLLDSEDADFFKQLNEDVAVAEEDAKVEANIIHGFDSYKSAIVL
jgi:hypothetical protein